MTSKPYEIHWTKVRPGMQIAVERQYGFAWRLADVQQHPQRYQWRVVLGRDRDGPIVDEGGPGIQGFTVVVRDLPRADRDAIAALVQHIQNARDWQSREQLQKQLTRRIAAIR